MMHRPSDDRVLGYLGRALSLEFSAVQQYSAQARLVATWGLAEPARRLRNEASEEMGHVDRVIARMLALGAVPNASQLRPVRLGPDLQMLLRHDHRLEDEVIGLYDAAARYCAQKGDYDNRLFFETLLGEEKAHGGEIVQWLEELERPGTSVPVEQGATF